MPKSLSDFLGNQKNKIGVLVGFKLGSLEPQSFAIPVEIATLSSVIFCIGFGLSGFCSLAVSPIARNLHSNIESDWNL